jgi:hypothetical protein
MVDAGAPTPPRIPVDQGVFPQGASRFSRRGKVSALLAVFVIGTLALTFTLIDSQDVQATAPRSNPSAVTPVLTNQPAGHIGAPKSSGTTAPSSLTAPAASAPPLEVPPAQPMAVPSLSTLVADAEASGLEPGSNWTWSIGDTATHCGVIAGAGTGCTYGMAGLEYTVFAGAPTFALVAHELANAETQNDAIPSLLNEVAAAAAGTSWSPTDAVASCLVVHFMGFQDYAAGAWQCPASLATLVAAHIHDTY